MCSILILLKTYAKVLSVKHHRKSNVIVYNQVDGQRRVRIGNTPEINVCFSLSGSRYPQTKPNRNRKDLRCKIRPEKISKLDGTFPRAGKWRSSLNVHVLT